MSANETILVTGFGRCGTTLLMRMLHTAGVPVVAQSLASFEHNDFAVPSQSIDWNRFNGSAIKVLDPQRWRFAKDQRLRILFLSRDTKEQARSQAKLLAAQGLRLDRDAVRNVQSSLRRDYRNIGSAFGTHPRLSLQFEHILAEPEQQAGRIAQFIGLPETAAARMVEVVEFRSRICRADLSFELGQIAKEAA